MTEVRAGQPGRARLPATLVSALDGLTGNQLKLLESMARAMRVPVEIEVAVGTDIVTSVFAETMANLLTMHHALHEEPLNKKAFEYLFRNCLQADGHGARLNPAPGGEGWDVEGAGLRWSLKTEAAQGISRNQIKIEKLMEARWVREAVSPEQCAVAVAERLPRHMQDYDRILVLRAFKIQKGYEYALQEIPKGVLIGAFLSAGAENFSKRKTSISYGADFVDSSGRRLFRILLDSSVEKIRLWFDSSSAKMHGRWYVRVDEALGAQQKTIVS